jgi:hypothetical protein
MIPHWAAYCCSQHDISVFYQQLQGNGSKFRGMEVSLRFLFFFFPVFFSGFWSKTTGREGREGGAW